MHKKIQAYLICTDLYTENIPCQVSHDFHTGPFFYIETILMSTTPPYLIFQEAQEPSLHINHTFTHSLLCGSPMSPLFQISKPLQISATAMQVFNSPKIQGLHGQSYCVNSNFMVAELYGTTGIFKSIDTYLP